MPVGEVPEPPQKASRTRVRRRAAPSSPPRPDFTGTPDNTFRVFDKDTGKELWSKKLPINPLSVAATYQIAGRQSVVIAGSPREQGSAAEEAAAAAATAPQAPKEEAAYLVFALPVKSHR